MSIDYGTINIDKETGIRFGVINQNAVLQAWADESTPDYGPPTCPKCGFLIELPSCPDDDSEEPTKDAYCPDCDYSFDSDEAYGDGPNFYILDDGEQFYSHPLYARIEDRIRQLEASIVQSLPEYKAARWDF